MGTIFVAELLGNDEAIAAIEAEHVDEARAFLMPAMKAMNRHLFQTGAKRWDDLRPIVTREALPFEAAEWRKHKSAQPQNRSSPVVWLIDFD